MSSLEENLFMLSLMSDMVAKRIAEGRPEEQAALAKMKKAFGEFEARVGPPFKIERLSDRVEFVSNIRDQLVHVYSGEKSGQRLESYVDELINEHGHPPERLTVVHGTVNVGDVGVLLMIAPVLPGEIT